MQNIVKRGNYSYVFVLCMVGDLFQNSTQNIHSTSTNLFTFNKNIHSTSTNLFTFNKNIHSTSTNLFIFNKNSTSKKLFTFNENIYSTSKKLFTFNKEYIFIQLQRIYLDPIPIQQKNIQLRQIYSHFQLLGFQQFNTNF